MQRASLVARSVPPASAGGRHRLRRGLAHALRRVGAGSAPDAPSPMLCQSWRRHTQGVETVVEDLLHGDPEWHRLAALPGLQEGWAELKVKAAAAIAECQARARRRPRCPPVAPRARGGSPARPRWPCALVDTGGPGVPPGAAAPADAGAPRRARVGGGAGGARAAAGRAGGEPGGRRARGGRGRRRCARRRVARAPALQRGRAARARLLPCCSSASRA